MLWYKAWRESKTRFLLGIVVVAGWYGTYVVLYPRLGAQGDIQQDYTRYIWTWIYGVRDPLRSVYLILALWLGAGGLLRERALGTAAYTLSLPTSRFHLIGARASVAFLEVVVLSFVPVLLNALSPAWVGHMYPGSQALQFAVLWIVVGALMVSLTILASSILDGEYTAPIVALIVVLVYSHATTLAPLSHHPLNIHAIMSGRGMPYFQEASALLIGPFPWTTCAVIGAVAAGSVIAAAIVTQRHDF